MAFGFCSGNLPSLRGVPQASQFCCSRPLVLGSLPRRHVHPNQPRHEANRSNVTVSLSVARVSVDELRAKIAELAGPERGIFGLDSTLRKQIHTCVEAAEAQSPISAPAAENAIAASGCWRLLYTTLTILGRRRVKLAIGTKSKPGFVKLGEFYQTVDPGPQESRNIVVFNMALGGSGTFTISAKYEVESDTRVLVETQSCALEPVKLEELLGENISLLSQIFDPTGFLDITYLDENLRIGRDDKGNIFVLERCEYNG